MGLGLTKRELKLLTFLSDFHNIIQIRNNDLWNWKYFVKFSMNMENIMQNIVNPT